MSVAGSMAASLGFSDLESGLSSYVNHVKILQTFDETSPEFNWAAYLSCVSVLPGGAKPGHPLHFPLDVRQEDLSPPLSAAIAQAMVRRFEVLRAIRDRLANSLDASGNLDAALVEELGPRAMRAIRELGRDLEVDCFDAGETYVMGLKLREAIPPSAIGGAHLIQIGNDVHHLSESDKWNTPWLQVTVYALVYRLPDDSVLSRSIPSAMRKLCEFRQLVQDTFVKRLPSKHARVEFRDAQGATVMGGRPVGPTYAEVMEEIRRNREPRQAT
jgi:hypothetical protein